MSDQRMSGFVDLVLNAIALAMGIAVIVLSALGTVDVQSAVLLLGIGLAALALTMFQKGARDARQESD